MTVAVARSLSGIGALWLALACGAHAHDAWVELDGPAHRVLYGHEGKLEPYDASKAKRIAARDREGKPVKATVVTAAEGVAVRLAAPASLILLDFDNGYWTKTAEGWQNRPRTAVGDALESSHSLKFGKTVLAWSPSVNRAYGQRLEIVPLSPQRPRPGDTLVLRVLYEGKPLAGAKIASGGYDHEQATTTDAKGRVSVAVQPARQIIVASHTVALQRPEAEKESLAANLRFETP